MDDIRDIQEFYDRADEDNRLDRHPLEWDITWRYLERHLPLTGHVLELGAASGRYTLELARRGYTITALDLSPGQTDLARAKAEAAGLVARIRYLVGDARALAVLAGEHYDAALVMGPLYHLVFEEDRRRVLREVRALLRPGAPLFTAFIARLGLLSDVMKKIPAWITSTEEVASVMAHGRDPKHVPPGFRGYFARVEEIAPLHESEGYETLVLPAAEPCIGAEDESYARLPEALRRPWLDLLFQVSAEPSLLGASRHLLYIGRKPGVGRW